MYYREASSTWNVTLRNTNISRAILQVEYNTSSTRALKRIFKLVLIIPMYGLEEG